MSPFLLLCLTGFLAIFSTTMAKNPVLPFFAEHLGANPVAIGIVASLSPLAGVLVSLPAGIFSDYFGRMRLLKISALFFALTPLGYLFISEIWQLALVRFLHGLATGIFVPVAMALVTDTFLAGRGERLGFMSSASQLGRFLAPLAGGILLTLPDNEAEGSGFTLVYLTCLLLGVLTALLVFRLPQAQPPPTTTNRSFRHSVRAVLQNRLVLQGCIMESAALFAFGAFEAFFPQHVRTAGLGTEWAGGLMSVQVLAVALSKPLFGKLSDSHGRVRQIVLGALLLGCIMLLMGQTGSIVTLAAASLGLGLALSLTLAASSAFIADTSDADMRGASMGLLGAIMDIGHSTGPVVAGAVTASLGASAGFASAGTVVLGTTLLFAFMTRNYTPKTISP
ncbi:MFS transporter [Desulfovibrio mangrovi]|uniref:MFS transporter n=1 Tax=Desulfovibrio mangrovi TaxID=2976983 RepID=UPI00224822CA|nr:MFS transporter [Desulfovibrio mangrovi]UZP66189.1 MFS transporter [Desulfovibrio mangrovi]